MSITENKHKLIELRSENIKKLKAISITPDQNVNLITGANGSGKTSILDSIWWALTGKSNIQDEPIRQGEESARVDLSFGTFTVTRKFTRREDGDFNTYLEVKNADGAVYPNPQDMLNKMLGDIAFDPLEFSNMKPAEQYALLKRVSGLDNQIEVVQKDEKELYDQRTTQNREVVRLNGSLATKKQGLPEKKPEPVDAAAVQTTIDGFNQRENLQRLLTSIQQGSEKLKADIQNAEKNKQDATDRYNRKVREAQVELEQSMQDADDAIADREAQLSDNRLRYVENQKAMETLPTREQYDEALGSITESQHISGVINRFEEVEREEAELRKAQAIVTDLTTRIEAKRDEMKAIMEQAKLPVEGLQLQDGAVYYRGIPYEQCSSADRLRIAVAIAMAANPSIRIVQIRDGSLLDSQNLQLVEQLAKEYDFQAWIERVDETGQVGIYIEDGAVVSSTPNPTNQS